LNKYVQSAVQSGAEGQFRITKGVMAAQLNTFWLTGHGIVLVHLDEVGVVISVPELTPGNLWLWLYLWIHFLFLSLVFSFPCGK